MVDVLGRADGPADATPDGPRAQLGRHLAPDGDAGGPVGLDLDRPHVALVVGKRGSGKSHTLGVLAEDLIDAGGVVPVVVDPMGVFRGLDAAGATVRDPPRVHPDAVPPRSLCALLDLDPASAAGGLVWRAATAEPDLDGMRRYVESTGADRAARRAATNHLRMAAAWGVFDTNAPDVAATLEGPATVLAVDHLDPAPANAVVHAVAAGLYDALRRDDTARLPWLLVDEAHGFVDGAAGPALDTLLTRGRQPGLSVCLATQRPGALPETALSQADLLLAHSLSTERDLDALAAARPRRLADTLRGRLPTIRGRVLVDDDATDSVRTVQVRDRRTRHGGDSPRASDRQG